MKSLSDFLVLFSGFLVLCFVISYTISAENGDHPFTYTFIENSGQRSCTASKNKTYLVGTELVTWYEAYVLCRRAGMELVSINSQEENDALENHAKTLREPPLGRPGPYWTAGTRNGACGSQFVWLTTGKPVIYTNWAAKQPDNWNGSEACVEIGLYSDFPYQWNDLNCDKVLGYACQSSSC